MTEQCPTCGQDLPKPLEVFGDIDQMIFLNSSKASFHCDAPIPYDGSKWTTCGCNVFRKSKSIPYHYKCNACGATFTGE